LEKGEQTMKTIGTAWGVWAAVVTAVLLWPLPLQAAGSAAPRNPAARLVQETLEREATGDLNDRRELLRPVLSQASRCEAAYWQSGFVYDLKRRKWVPWDELPQLAAKDISLARYMQIRTKYSDSIDDQMQLARWHVGLSGQ
jgi:hypothetical protein